MRDDMISTLLQTRRFFSTLSPRTDWSREDLVKQKKNNNNNGLKHTFWQEKEDVYPQNQDVSYRWTGADGATYHPHNNCVHPFAEPSRFLIRKRSRTAR